MITKTKEEINKERKQKMEDLTKKLESGIENIFESGQYQEYLTVMNTFHDYSYYNSVLIHTQMPNATKVASYAAWEKLGRQVNRGEKAISIFAPNFYKAKVKKKKVNDTTGEEETVEEEENRCAFKPVPVFDISQTSGRELPSLTKKLLVDIEDCDTFIDALIRIAEPQVKFKTMSNNITDSYDKSTNTILINQAQSETQIIKSLLNRISDYNLSKDMTKDSLARNIESESIAFVVCQYYDIDTSDYTFGQVAKWSADKDLKVLKNSLKTIKKESDILIDKIDEILDI